MASATFSSDARHGGNRAQAARRLQPAAGLSLAGLFVVAALGVGHAGVLISPTLIVALPVACVFAPILVARPRLAVAAVIVALPVGATYAPGIHLKVIEVMCLAAAGAVALRRTLRGTGPLPWPRSAWLVLALVCVAALSTASSVTPSDSVKQDITFVLGALFSLSLVAVVSRPIDLRRILTLLVLVGGGICAQAIPGAQNLKASFGGSVVDNRPVGVFSQPNELGGFSAAILVAAVALGLTAPSLRARLGWAAIAATAATSMGLSLSRGSLIGTTLGIVAIVALLPAHRMQIVLALAAMTMGLTAMALTRSGPQQLQVVGARVGTLTRSQQSPYDDRVAIWKEAVRQFEEKPFIGFGPGSFPITSARSQSPGIFPDVTHKIGQSSAVLIGADHAHNVLLTFAAEQGALSVLLVVGFSLTLGWTVWRVSRRVVDASTRGVVAGVGAALCTFVGQGLVDVTLHNPVMTTLVWLLVGLVLAADRLTAPA
jgi:putative inorganic carbon (hco3(-)) transporter